MGKLVKCKTCGADIAPDAKTCPKCGARTPFAEAWFWAMVIAVVIGIVTFYLEYQRRIAG